SHQRDAGQASNGVLIRLDQIICQSFQTRRALSLGRTPDSPTDEGFLRPDHVISDGILGNHSPTSSSARVQSLVSLTSPRKVRILALLFRCCRRLPRSGWV